MWGKIDATVWYSSEFCNNQIIYIFSYRKNITLTSFVWCLLGANHGEGNGNCCLILLIYSYNYIAYLWNYIVNIQFSSVQSLSWIRLFVTPWIAARQASLSITISRNSLRLTSIESVMPSSHLILCRPLLLLPPIPPSIRVFSNESTLRMRCPKYWSFSFSIIPSKEIPGLISFRTDWLDLLAVQGTLKSLLQHHSSKASIFGPQLFSQSNSHIYTWLLEKP